MTDSKNPEAPRNTQTVNPNDLDGPTGNIYEAIVIIAKRADQIGEDIKLELNDKLEEFATHSESLEEIFENKEQIEVSRYYEALPKPPAMAIDEWNRGEIYWRRPTPAPEAEGEKA